MVRFCFLIYIYILILILNFVYAPQIVSLTNSILHHNAIIFNVIIKLTTLHFKICMAWGTAGYRVNLYCFEFSLPYLMVNSGSSRCIPPLFPYLERLLNSALISKIGMTRMEIVTCFPVISKTIMYIL